MKTPTKTPRELYEWRGFCKMPIACAQPSLDIFSTELGMEIKTENKISVKHSGFEMRRAYSWQSL